MSKLFKTEGVVLRRFALGEADQLVTLLTPDRGKITALAKGARKLTSKFCGRLELGYQIRFTAYAGRDFGYFKEIEVVRGGQGFQLALLGHAALGAILEITLKLLREGQGSDVYPLLPETMASLLKQGTEKSVLKAYFKTVLMVLGFQNTEDLFIKPLKSEAMLAKLWSG